MPLLSVGDEAPGFSVHNQDGDDVSLAQYRGRPVLLWWYPKASTPG
jgi:peroxiredoxin Q/BCP